MGDLQVILASEVNRGATTYLVYFGIDYQGIYYTLMMDDMTDDELIPNKRKGKYRSASSKPSAP